MGRDLQIFGPYQRGNSFRCVLGDGKTRTPLPAAPTPEAARRIADSTLRRIIAETPVSLADALDRYREHLTAKGNKPVTITTTLYRLRRFFVNIEQPVGALTPRKCASLYETLAKQQKADTQKNTLAEAKTFGRWLVEQNLIRESPVEKIKPIGKRSHGKEQLTRDEAQRWLREALRLAEAGDDAALAASMALLMGLRAGEIIARTVRDVDDGGTRLRVRQTKTRAGERDPKIPDVLQPLIAERCRGKLPGALLFETMTKKGSAGPHDVSWVRKSVQKICRTTKVPTVCAHSMRGLHADLAVEAGLSPDVVAKSLGHTSPKVTMRHYAQPETLRDVQRERAAEQLGVSRPAVELRLVP